MVAKCIGSTRRVVCRRVFVSLALREVACGSEEAREACIRSKSFSEAEAAGAADDRPGDGHGRTPDRLRGVTLRLQR